MENIIGNKRVTDHGHWMVTGWSLDGHWMVTDHRMVTEGSVEGQ